MKFKSRDFKRKEFIEECCGCDDVDSKKIAAIANAKLQEWQYADIEVLLERINDLTSRVLFENPFHDFNKKVGK